MNFYDYKSRLSIHIQFFEQFIHFIKYLILIKKFHKHIKKEII